MKKQGSSDYRRMPWKNGAGTTVEIAVFPEGASIEDFSWRVSRAEVVCDGDFSRFVGIDRSLALLRGKGMRLECDGEWLQVDEKNKLVRFSGEAKTRAELIDGAIADFNVMSRSAVCSHQLSVVENGQLPSDIAFLYCAKGSGKLIREDEVIPLGEDDSVSDVSSKTSLKNYTLLSSAGSVFYCVQLKWK